MAMIRDRLSTMPAEKTGRLRVMFGSREIGDNGRDGAGNGGVV
jgi:hypothetical protein